KVKNILVVNRPTTKFELLYKKNQKTISGSILLQKGGFTLTKVRENIFIVDYISSDILGQFNKKHLWFIEKYSDQNYIDFIHDCIDFLGFQNFKLINQNIFSYKLAIRLNANNKIFDAWDNFLKFPKYQKIKKELEYGYRALSQEIPNWT